MKINLFLGKLLSKFTEHPSEVGESYWEHLKVASGLSAKLAACAAAQLVHAVFPFFKPPFGLDVCSMSDYLQNKQPEMRKNCKDEADQKYAD